jgi:hypothetical protein
LLESKKRWEKYRGRKIFEGVPKSILKSVDKELKLRKVI